jgi:hypothetical protein
MNDWYTALDEVARTMKGQPTDVVLESLRAATSDEDPWDETVMLLAASDISKGLTLHFKR